MSLATPIAVGGAVAAAGAATTASAAACAAAAAALAAAGAALVTASASCCQCCRPPPPVRTKARATPELHKTPSQRQVPEEPAPPPPVTPRTLRRIEYDDELLPRARAAQHLMHAIAEANESLITAGILARLGYETTIAEPEGLPMWEWGSWRFVKSGAVATLGAAAVVTAPLSIPSNALFGGGFVAAQGVALLAGSAGEMSRSLLQESFLELYGIRKEDLKWSVIPASTLFWHIAEGDGVLELIFKAKRGAFGLASLTDTSDRVIMTKLRRLLCKILDCTPGTPRSQARRLNEAIRKSARDMSPGNAPKALLLEEAFRTAATDFGHPKVSALMDVVRKEMDDEEAQPKEAAAVDALAELHSA